MLASSDYILISRLLGNLAKDKQLTGASAITGVYVQLVLFLKKVIAVNVAVADKANATINITGTGIGTNDATVNSTTKVSASANKNGTSATCVGINATTAATTNTTPTTTTTTTTADPCLDAALASLALVLSPSSACSDVLLDLRLRAETLEAICYYMSLKNSIHTGSRRVAIACAMHLLGSQHCMPPKTRKAIDPPPLPPLDMSFELEGSSVVASWVGNFELLTGRRESASSRSRVHDMKVRAKNKLLRLARCHRDAEF
jgi:hypothetical protein